MNAAKLIVSRAHSVRDLTENVPSPCVSVCTMNAATEYCDGCLRTVEEIAAWSVLPDSAKKQIWSLLEQRAASLHGPISSQATGGQCHP